MNFDFVSLFNKENPRRFDLYLILLSIFYVIFLQPYSISVWGSGVSINYLFLLIPVTLLVVRKELVFPHIFIIAPIIFFSVQFLIAITFSGDGSYILTRRFLSFCSFMSVFALCFVRFDGRHLRAFKIALIFSALYLSVNQYGKLLSLHYPHTLEIEGFDLNKGFITFSDILFKLNTWFLKDVIGSSRTGFIYVSAFFVILLSDFFRGRFLYVKSVVLFLIAVGLTMTYARATIITMFLTLVLFLFFYFRGLMGFRLHKKHFQAFLFFCFLYLLFCILHPGVVYFYVERFVLLYLSPEALAGELNNLSSSEGTRISEWRHIIVETVRRPFLGSGFIGVWNTKVDLIGSAHNQFFDVMYRTGFAGLTIYFFLTVITGLALFKVDKALFFVLAACVLFGLFHESFKESHGAFIFAMLLWVSSDYYKSKRRFDTEAKFDR